MRVRLRARALGALSLGWLSAFIPVISSAQNPPTFKVAYFNIQSGHGEAAIAGHAVTFTETTNCSDPSLPMNAWGTGLVQSHLVASLGSDPRVVALGLGEAWTSVCGSPERVRQALGWKARTTERNGVAMVARHGFAGPDEWLQLDTSLNPNPADTMWVVRAPVCLDAACSQSIDVFVGHWLGSDTATGPASLDQQGRQTANFLKSRGGQAPHVFVGDLNAWEGTPACAQTPNGSGLSHLRDAGYIDAWRAIHGDAEGFTGMVNRSTCGNPRGYPFKRIDYAWTPPGLYPLSIQRFGMVPPGDGAPSDHYGIIAEYPWPGGPPPAPPPSPSPPPPPPPVIPGGGAEVVLHAKAAVIVGAWRLEIDQLAAGGARVAQPDAGAPKVPTALAAPAHYFELDFNAQAGIGYRLWIRGTAAGDYWGNDSVYAQFSGSVTESGAAVWRIGTVSATKIVLEECDGCGLNGWGWQDNGYGLNALGPLVYFQASGVQTIRIQAREDGIAIDQIVLSGTVYLTTAPGATTGDQTILPTTAPAPEETPVPTPAPPATREEIVIRAGSVATVAGRWRTVADSSAAGGTVVTHPNAGAPKLVSPMAIPADFVEFTFDADAGRPYRLWLRGRADGDSWSNDSVFVQFSGAVADGGRPVWRIGTDSATSVNLEEGSNVGVSGWGWQDNGYGVAVLGPLITFEAGGPQTIRIQTREDGLRIDQIVLSSGTYLNAAPGSSKDDRTILR